MTSLSLEAKVRPVLMNLLSDEHYGDLTVEEIAARAGVPSHALYERWNNKAGLVVDLVTGFVEELPAVDTGNVRDDLVVYLAAWIAALEGPMRTLQVAVVTAVHRAPEFLQAHDAVNECHRRALGRILDRGVERGQIPRGANHELAIEMLLARAAYRFMFQWRLTGVIARETVDDVVMPVLHHTAQQH